MSSAGVSHTIKFIGSSAGFFTGANICYIYESKNMTQSEKIINTIPALFIPNVYAGYQLYKNKYDVRNFIRTIYKKIL